MTQVDSTSTLTRGPSEGGAIVGGIVHAGPGASPACAALLTSALRRWALDGLVEVGELLVGRAADQVLAFDDLAEIRIRRMPSGVRVEFNTAVAVRLPAGLTSEHGSDGQTAWFDLAIR